MLEKVYLVCKSSSRGRPHYAVAEAGKIPPRYHEVSRPKTRTLYEDRALFLAQERQDRSDENYKKRQRKLACGELVSVLTTSPREE